MPDLFVFPYLHLQDAIEVGPYRLIPRKEIPNARGAEPWITQAASGLLELYRLPDADPLVIRIFGCIVASKTNGIGAPIDRTQLPFLRRAVLGATLDENPRTRVGIGSDQVVTSDNALLYGHPVDREGRVAVEYGFMSRRLVGGLQIGSSHALINAPAELRLPMFATPPDGDYADALYGLLAAGDTQAHRLGLAIDWLDLAWRNTESIGEHVRIVGLRAGFEALLGVGEDFKAGRKALSALLEPAGAQVRPHTYPNRKGTPVTEDLTDLAWWFCSFCFLRNKIAHGAPVPSGDYEFEDERHITLADRRLRDAIKNTVARAGHPDVLRGRFAREVARAIAAMGRENGSEIM